MRRKDLRSLSGTTRRVRGFLISAVNDLTVFIAFCLALWPALITASERDDKDLSEATDGDRLCFRFTMIAKRFFLFVFSDFLYICLFLYTI